MKSVPKIALFGGSFNPPGDHHVAIVRTLAALFDTVLIVPCGPRSDKETTQHCTPTHRGEMATLAFQPLVAEFTPKVELDLFDLSNTLFTRTYLLEQRYASRGEIWHVVGADLVRGGANGVSQIQNEWVRGRELWSESKFVVLTRSGFEITPADLPPHHLTVSVSAQGSSSEIRQRVSLREEYLGIPKVVANYIREKRLYR